MPPVLPPPRAQGHRVGSRLQQTPVVRNVQPTPGSAQHHRRVPRKRPLHPAAWHACFRASFTAKTTVARNCYKESSKRRFPDEDVLLSSKGNLFFMGSKSKRKAAASIVATCGMSANGMGTAFEPCEPIYGLL